jgi:hypothetical protein
MQPRANVEGFEAEAWASNHPFPTLMLHAASFFRTTIVLITVVATDVMVNANCVFPGSHGHT